MKQQVINRISTLEDIAYAVCYDVSRSISYTKGHTLTIAGGGHIG